jgi:phage tail-like protein
MRALLKTRTAVLSACVLGAGAILAYAGVLYPQEAAEAMGSERRDYTTIHNFNVEIDGVVVGGFKEVDGLESKTEVIEYQEGNERIMHKRPGKTNYSNIILRRGNLHTPELWDWRKKIVDGVQERKSGSIIVLDTAGEEIVRYNFFEAWPCRWKGPSLNSASNDALEEEIELCVEYWERD